MHAYKPLFLAYKILISLFIFYSSIIYLDPDSWFYLCVDRLIVCKPLVKWFVYVSVDLFIIVITIMIIVIVIIIIIIIIMLSALVIRNAYSPVSSRMATIATTLLGFQYWMRY
jgi:hypothetical protein